MKVKEFNKYATAIYQSNAEIQYRGVPNDLHFENFARLCQPDVPLSTYLQAAGLYRPFLRIPSQRRMTLQLKAWVPK